MYSLPILRDAFSRVSAFPFSSSRACVCALWHVSVPFPHASGWPCAPPLRFTLFDTFLCHPALADFSTSRHTFPYAAPLFSPLSRSFFLVVLSLLFLTMLYKFLLFQVSLQLLQHPPYPPPPYVDKFWTHPPCRSR